MRVIMPAIIDQAGRNFNVDETDGVNRRHTDPYVANGLVIRWRVRKWTTVVGEGASKP
jgi:hypothetical protein